MTMPGPAQRLVRRLDALPDGTRQLEAQVERVAARGGGEFMVRLHVDSSGEIVAMELVTRFERRVQA